MQKETKFRHEYKYLCTQAQMADLENRISALIPRDAHLYGRSFYGIRSAYFDDFQNSCYYQNEDGVDPRYKYRIRIYDGEDTVIKLERKKKVRGMTAKDSCSLSREMAERLLAGEIPEFSEDMPFLLKYFISEMNMVHMQPKIIVDYLRTPYIYSNGNVRITFDREISSAPVSGAFFGKEIARRPVMPLGQALLEVKFDEYLPDFIYHALNIPDLERVTFSKYYLCRRYTL